LRIYLVAYFLLVLGAVVALWHGDVLQQVPVSWTVVGIAVAVGLGITLAVSSAKPEITRD
jgi:hypothetical protein